MKGTRQGRNREPILPSLIPGNTGGSYVIRGPRRADQTSGSFDSALYSACRLSEGGLCSLLQFPLAKFLDRNFPPFTGAPDAVAKEFAFRRVNQRMGRENSRQRRQGSSGSQQHGSTYDSNSARLQFPPHPLDSRRS